MQFVEFQVCRGCLATDTRMVDTRQSFTSDVIRLVELLPTSKVGLPPCVCYECLAQLTKMRDFHAKNQRAYNVLLKILQQRGRIEEKHIKQIDRNQQSLTSPLKFHQIESINIEPKLFYCDGEVEDRKDEIIPELIDMHNDFKIEFSQEEKIKNDDWFEDFNNFSDDNHSDISTIDITLNNKEEKENVKETEQVKVETERKKGKNVNSIMPKSRKRKTTKETSKQEPGAEDQKVPKVKKKQAPRTPAKVDPMKCHYTEDYHSFSTLTVMTEEERLEVFKQRREKQQYINAGYQCTDCYLGFTSSETYENHREKHDPNIGEYICPLCKCRYKTQKLQLKHIAMVHRTKFECKYCTHVCTSGQQAKIHSKKHSSATYRCQECNYISTQLASYNLHVSRMHGEEAPCQWCGVTFLDYGAMRTHSLATHPRRSRGQSRLTCECGAVFYNLEARKLHRSISSKHTPDGSTLLSCALCDSRFTDKESLKAHTHTHPQEQKEPAARHLHNMTCKQCGEVVSGRSAYRMHYSVVHPDKTCFLNEQYPDMLCDICGKIMKGMNSLKIHKFMHTGLRPFVCTICDKRFSQRINFDLHMNIHTKKNVYKCRVCGKGFNNSANRNRHIKLVHTQERLFSCDICGKCFKSQVEKLSHTQYVHMKKPWPKRNRSKRKPTQRQQHIDKESSD